MKSKISALMDGELDRHEADAALEALKHEGDARDTWRAYHLISDSMRDARLLSAGFAARVAGKIAQEPTVLAPSRAVRWHAARPPVWALAAAASLAVAFVGGSTFLMMQQDKETPPQVAQATPAEELAQVAPPDAADDYLLAHQGYSPRNSLQGVASYVRTVSSESRGARR